MFFKKLENGKPTGGLITEDNLRAFLDTVDFDRVNGNALFFESQGYAVINLEEKPVATALQDIVEGETVRQNDGSWIQKYKAVDKPNDEKTKLLNREADRVKHKKENKLLVVDNFIASPEYHDVLEELNAYKTALKAVDLTDPFNVVWPEPPHEDTGIILPY